MEVIDLLFTRLVEGAKYEELEILFTFRTCFFLDHRALFQLNSVNQLNLHSDGFVYYMCIGVSARQAVLEYLLTCNFLSISVI